MGGEGGNSAGEEGGLPMCIGKNLCVDTTLMEDGMILAVMLQDLIKKKGYPSWTNVTCLREGTETPLFKQNFANWVDKNETTSLVKPVRSRQTGTSYK